MIWRAALAGAVLMWIVVVLTYHGCVLVLPG